MSSQRDPIDEHLPVIIVMGQSEDVIRECRAECSLRGWLLHAVDDHESLPDSIESTAASAIVLSLAAPDEVLRNTCRAIRMLRADRYTWIVAFSREAPDSGGRRARTLGFDEFVPYEAGVKQLCDEVMSLMDTASPRFEASRGRRSHYTGPKRRRSDKAVTPAAKR